MAVSSNLTPGIKRMVEKYRDEFRRAENTEHYRPGDYKKAERKYIKYCLEGSPGSAASD